MAIDDSKRFPPEVEKLIPEGEKILWTGQPEWKSLAYQAYGIKYIFLYLLICGFYVFVQIGPDFLFEAFAVSFSPFLVSGLSASLILTGIAYFTAVHTQYVITEKRVILRNGIALIFVLNVPFSKIVSIDRQNLSRGKGNVVFVVSSKRRIPFLSLWPSVKPWSISEPIPSFRSVKNVAKLELVLVKTAESISKRNGRSLNLKVEDLTKKEAVLL